MITNDNAHSTLNNRNKNNGTKLFKLPIQKIKKQSRNTSTNNNLTKASYLKKNSLYSTKEATPRKEYNHVLTHSGINNNFQKTKEKIEKNELDDSLSQMSQILNNNNKNLNFSGLISKCPGIYEETNFVYDQMLFNKSSIKKAKILSHKIGVLKLPISNISSKEALSNSGREKKCFSDRVQDNGNHDKQNINNNKDDNADVLCCFFEGNNKKIMYKKIIY